MNKVTFWYRNHRGEEGYRRVRPISLRYGTSDYYKEPQWLLLALDLEKDAEREFALAQAARPVGRCLMQFATGALVTSHSCIEDER